jgi:hypothetical protein
MADAVEKGFLRCRPATLIQDQEQTRNLDSKIHLLGFVRFNFQFHSSYAATFSTASARSRHGAYRFGFASGLATSRACSMKAARPG